MTPTEFVAFAKAMRENRVATLKMGDITIQLFPDAPELDLINHTVAQVKESVGGCAKCGNPTASQRLVPGMCDNCVKKEAIGG